MTAGDAAPLRRPARTWVAAGVSAAVLGVAVIAGLRSSPTSLGPLIAVESLSARFSGALLAAGAAAPLGYALLAGMVASVNPCGFVLLPTYLGYYLGDRRDGAGVRRATGRALAVSVTMTAGFVALFGLAGILAALAASALTSSLPWLGTAVGVSLIALAGLLASGRALDFPLPVFLSVVGTSLQAHGLADAVGQFLLFGLGMGIIITALTIATAWFGDGLIKRVRIIGRHIGWASAVMLWLAGAYVIYYWLTTTRLL